MVGTRVSLRMATAVVASVSTLYLGSCSALPSGSGDGDPVAGAPTEPPDPVADASTAPTTTAFVTPDDDEDEEETIVDLEQQWATQRAAVVAQLALEQYGIDEDNVLNGPGRFTLDLDDCPREWSDTAGLDGDVIRIAMTIAQSGEYQQFDDLASGMRAYFGYVNANGGIDGRRIELIVRDDGYDPARTTEVVSELLEADEPFYITTVGSPGSLAVHDDLNRACVPQPFVVSPHPAWGDPSEHPFTTGFQQAYTTEAILWGNWIKDNLADEVPVTVGALVIDNDFGRLYADAFETWAETNRDIVSELIVVTHDPGALTVPDEMAELAEAAPRVFLSMTAGQPCLSAVEEAARSGLTDSAVALFTPSGCKQPEQYLAPVGAAGHGFWVVGGGVKSTVDPAYADETFVKFVNEQLAEAGLDPGRVLVGVGFAQYGWAHVEMLRLASALPGGLSRSNLVLALRGADLAHPMLLEGVRFASEGNLDAFFIEGGEYSRYDSDSRAWFQQGPAVDVDGASPNCSWTRSACRSQ